MHICAAGYLGDSYNPCVCERKWVWERQYVLGQRMVMISFRAISTMRTRKVCFFHSDTWIVIWTKKWGTFCWIRMRRGGVWLQSLQMDLFSSSVPPCAAGRPCAAPTLSGMKERCVLLVCSVLGSQECWGLLATLHGDPGAQRGMGCRAWQRMVRQGGDREPGICIS